MLILLETTLDLFGRPILNFVVFNGICNGKNIVRRFFRCAITNSSDVFTNLFHEFFPRIFLSLSSWNQTKTAFFFFFCKLKQKYRKIFKKNCRIGIRVWWNYLMNLSFINISHFNNFKYNVHIHSSTWGLGTRFKPVVWKSIILNCHLLNCGTENRKSPTVLRDVHFTQGLLSQANALT